MSLARGPASAHGAAPLIGAAPPDQARRGDGAIVLPAGSTLLLYTDGLIETHNRDLDEGIALLAELAGIESQASPQQTFDQLLAARRSR